MISKQDRAVNRGVRSKRGNGAVVLSLVPAATDRETIQVLRGLLADAEAGRISGLAAVATYKGSDYSGFLTGFAKHHPTTTRGMLDELKDELKAVDW